MQIEEKILQRLNKQDEKMELIYRSVEKTRKMFLMTIVVSVIAFLLPLLGLVFLIPWFLHVMSSAYQGLL